MSTVWCPLYWKPHLVEAWMVPLRELTIIFLWYTALDFLVEDPWSCRFWSLLNKSAGESYSHSYIFAMYQDSYFHCAELAILDIIVYNTCQVNKKTKEKYFLQAAFTAVKWWCSCMILPDSILHSDPSQPSLIISQSLLAISEQTNGYRLLSC